MTLASPNAQDTLNTWLSYWGELHVSAIDLGLDRVVPVAQRLGVQQRPQAQVFTVAGTNGKGSTTTVIAAITHAAGYKVGLYQSPHIYRFNERIQIAGAAVSDAELVAAFVAVEAARQACHVSLSFFEATTLAAFWIFQQQQCDVWVLEIGLGGRLDVVNIIDPDVAVITNIGLDHTDWLGDSIEQIAYEKAGIIRPNIPVIFAGEQPLPQAILQKAQVAAAQLYVVGRDYVYSADAATACHNNSQNTASWHFACAAQTLELPPARLALPNCAAAVAAVLCSSLCVTHSHLQMGLQQAKLAGRFDVRDIAGRTVIFDAGHNPHGMQFLITQLQQFLSYNRQFSSVQAVFSMLADKDIEQVTTILAPHVTHWHIAAMRLPRAATLPRLKAALLGQHVDCYDSVQQAFAQVMAHSVPEQLIVVCGSFHTLEAVWEYLQHGHE